MKHQGMGPPMADRHAGDSPDNTYLMAKMSNTHSTTGAGAAGR